MTQRRVGRFDRSTRVLALVGLASLLLAACGKSASHPAGGADAGAKKESFDLVFEQLDGALISVSGSSSSDVWTVGADTRDGRGALVLHYDGSTWTRQDTSANADLWWVHVFSSSSIFMGGSKGTILHYDGSAFTKMTTPVMSTVYGVWGASEDDVWAVGGEPDAEPGFLWHYDGIKWSDATDMLPAELQGQSLFKAWGRAKDDAWVVGVDGVAAHWDGSAFASAATGTTEKLFTVHGSSDGKTLVAVGGDANGVIVERVGTKWHKLVPNPAPTQLFGVFCHSADLAYAVGYDGTVLERNASAWKLLDIGHELPNPFHAVWVDPDGGVWAVGGDLLNGPAPTDGMLVHKGKSVPHEIQNP
jgi:hypothetical protein